MCRNLASGGRRCPSHSDPAAIAARNEKRRAAYALKKRAVLLNSETLLPPTPHVQEITQKFISLDRLSESMKNSVDIVEGEHKSYDDLNVSSLQVTGSLVDKSYFNHAQYDGVIDYSQLDENSYKEFGFAGPDEKREYDVSFEEMEELSREELSQLTDVEQSAVSFYSTNEYRWISRSLYGSRPVPSDDEDPETRKPYFSGKRAKADYNHLSLKKSERTPEMMKEVVTHLDSALEKGPQIQRKVYRGMSRNNGAFAEYLDHPDGQVAGWVENHMRIGDEMVFDGYQSTTVSSDIGLNYASTEGLLMEIVSSSGVNITAKSTYDGELEVLLPRNRRYMVVGVHKKQKVLGVNVSNTVTLVQLVEVTDRGAICNNTNKQDVPALREDQTLTEAEW